MTEVIYRIESNESVIEHKAVIPHNNLNDIIYATIAILRSEWQENALEQALLDYLM